MRRENPIMRFRLASFSYGVVAYAIGVGSLVYFVGFLANAVVPKGIDSGTVYPTDMAIIMNTVLLLLLPAQHSIMARPAFKKWWTRFVPVAIERSTFVLVTGLLVWLLFWQWRPLPVLVWNVELPAVRGILTAIYLSAWGVVFGSSFLIDHFDLFGLRQVYFSLIGQDYRPPVFVERLFYKWVRHPLMAGFIVTFWAAPTMSQGRLLFAVVMTAYIFVGITLEERDLLAHHGEDYAAYRRRTPKLLPLKRRTD
jgi:protein-S-isoprenylcysteine O-methyltransferase Ste14